MSSRFGAVYELVKKIPRGRVITYSGIARLLGWKNGARTVGWAMHHCPAGRGLPWHRVLGAGGRILLREPTGLLQVRLLESEGIAVSLGRVDLARRNWTPKNPHPAARKPSRARRARRNAIARSSRR